VNGGDVEKRELQALTMNAFHLVTFAQEILFGSGSIGQLVGATDRFGWQRLMICASPSLRRDGHIATLQTALGSRLVATYDQVKAHVQDSQLLEALALAADQEIDAVIGIGGGSPIGMAKAVSFALEEQVKGRPARAAFPTEQPQIPVIAIPTTYAGSEMTSVYGVTYSNDDPPRKITVRDPKITPKLVIYDPDLTLNLPPQVTASSGINALAHCIEALYSIGRNPLATAAARSAMEYIVKALPACTADGSDRDARGEMLVGSHLAGLALSATVMGLHHGLCHVLGGSANVPHGVANSIILPHAMRLNLDVAGPQLAQVARSMGFSADGEPDAAAARAAVDGVSQFIGQLGLPQRLRDAGVKEEALPRLAQLALQSRAVQDNPKPLTSAAQAEDLLRAAW